MNPNQNPSQNIINSSFPQTPPPSETLQSSPKNISIYATLSLVNSIIALLSTFFGNDWLIDLILIAAAYIQAGVGLKSEKRNQAKAAIIINSLAVLVDITYLILFA